MCVENPCMLSYITKRLILIPLDSIKIRLKRNEELFEEQRFLFQNSYFIILFLFVYYSGLLCKIVAKIRM